MNCYCLNCSSSKMLKQFLFLLFAKNYHSPNGKYTLRFLRRLWAAQTLQRVKLRVNVMTSYFPVAVFERSIISVVTDLRCRM